MLEYELGEAICSSENRIAISGSVGNTSLSVEASGLIAWAALFAAVGLTAFAISEVSAVNPIALPDFDFGGSGYWRSECW